MKMNSPYKLLSLAFHEPDASLISALRETDLFRKSLGNVSVADLKRAFTRLFSLTVAGGICPYETEYGSKDIFAKTSSLADISGFYRAFGMEVRDAQRVDFIGAELEFMDWLALKEERAKGEGKPKEAAICRSAGKKFLESHIGRWVPFFGEQIQKETSHPFYRVVARKVQETVADDCRRFGVSPEKVTEWRPLPSPEEMTCDTQACSLKPPDEDHAGDGERFLCVSDLGK